MISKAECVAVTLVWYGADISSFFLFIRQHQRTPYQNESPQLPPANGSPQASPARTNSVASSTTGSISGGPNHHQLTYFTAQSVMETLTRRLFGIETDERKINKSDLVKSVLAAELFGKGFAIWKRQISVSGFFGIFSQALWVLVFKSNLQPLHTETLV